MEKIISKLCGDLALSMNQKAKVKIITLKEFQFGALQLTPEREQSIGLFSNQHRVSFVCFYNKQKIIGIDFSKCNLNENEMKILASYDSAFRNSQLLLIGTANSHILRNFKHFAGMVLAKLQYLDLRFVLINQLNFRLIFSVPLTSLNHLVLFNCRIDDSVLLLISKLKIASTLGKLQLGRFLIQEGIQQVRKAAQQFQYILQISIFQEFVFGQSDDNKLKFQGALNLLKFCIPHLEQLNIS